MFEYLQQHKYIIVTGPQRSGTTIVTHMIAHDTKKVALDERNFNHRDIKLIPGILQNENSCVLQAPQALSWAPILTNYYTAFVYVKRDHKDIKKSLVNSRVPRGRRISQPWFTASQAIGLWLRIKELLDYPYELEYSLIEKHSLFVPVNQRNNGWTHKSISLNNKNRKLRVDYSQ